MKLLTDAKAIREAVKEARPRKIAVAYVGRDWKSFVPTASLKEIVVSPTLGSNAEAIRELLGLFGNNKVHFLDDLHSKIYLGEKLAIVGSCNLSMNALGDGRRYETAVGLTSSTNLRQLNELFDSYRAIARLSYPDEGAKLKKLKELEERTEFARKHGLWGESGSGPSPTLANFDLNKARSRVRFSWYDDDGPNPNMSVIAKEIPNAKVKTVEDLFGANYMWFGENDDIQAGDWVLQWPIAKASFNDRHPPTKNARISWFRVDHVVRNATDDPDTDYTKLVGMRKDVGLGQQPFVLDAKAKDLVRQMLCEPNFDFMSPRSDNSAWRHPSDKQGNGFIDELVRRYKA